jgi:hypothetical protein
VVGGAGRKLFLKGIQELKERWNKCIVVGGDYVEKCE